MSDKAKTQESGIRREAGQALCLVHFAKNRIYNALCSNYLGLQRERDHEINELSSDAKKSLKE
jgi:hypothetical protein